MTHIGDPHLARGNGPEIREREPRIGFVVVAQEIRVPGFILHHRVEVEVIADHCGNATPHRAIVPQHLPLLRTPPAIKEQHAVVFKDVIQPTAQREPQVAPPVGGPDPVIGVTDLQVVRPDLLGHRIASRCQGPQARFQHDEEAAPGYHHVGHRVVQVRDGGNGGPCCGCAPVGRGGELEALRGLGNPVERAVQDLKLVRGITLDQRDVGRAH